LQPVPSARVCEFAPDIKGPMGVERRGISGIHADRGWLTRLVADGSSEPFPRAGDEKDTLIPDELAICADDAVLAIERRRHRVVKIRTDGVVEPFSGTGFIGCGALDQLAIQTDLNYPHSLAILLDGSTAISDFKNDGKRI
jgi:hypothetical protein